MLKHLIFTNFKSWPKVDMAAAGVTGLFGTNSSGKTSILQFLLMLKQTKEATDRAISLELNGDYVQLGTFRDAIYRHNESLGIAMEVTFERGEPLTVADPSDRRGAKPLASDRTFRLSAEVGLDRKVPRTRRVSYHLGQHEFALRQGKGGFDLSARASQTGFRFTRTMGRKWPLPGPVKNYAFPDQVRTYFQNAGFLSDLEAAYEQVMDGILYLGPLREYPKRDYLWARSRPTDVGQRGEKAIDAILAATEAKLKLNLKTKTRLQDFQAIVAFWLRELGLIHSFEVAEIAEGSNRFQAWVATRQDATKVLLTDVGFGVSQVLPVVTLLLYAPEGSTVILEQPEIHLHPLAQAGLADVIIYAARHRRVQVLLESHSEHLLLRLQRRIAEGKVKSDEVKLYFCDIGAGGSTLTPLHLDLFGQIENWPERFMGDAFFEAAEAERARLRRMQEAAE